MKNKLFTTVLVLTCVFLSVFWIRERNYHSQINRIDAEVTAIETRVRMLRLRAEALKAEMELLSLTTYVEMVKGQKNGKATGRTNHLRMRSGLNRAKHKQQPTVTRKIPVRYSGEHSGKRVTVTEF